MVHELQALALDIEMIDESGTMMDLKQLEKDELKEEAKLDMSHQRFVNDAEEEGSLTIRDTIEEDDIPEAAEVGVDTEESGNPDVE